MLHLGTDTKTHADLGAGGDLEDLRTTSGGEGALVAANIVAVDGRCIADVGGRVGGELDGVELCGASKVADVLEAAAHGGTVHSSLVEEVVASHGLGENAGEKNGSLHLDTEEVTEEEKRVDG